MKMRWKRLPLDIRGQWAALYVTMNKIGEIVMSRITWERFGKPNAVHIFFDDTNQYIGLQPTSLGVRDAYPLNKTGPSGGRSVAAYRLLQEYQINIDMTIQFYDAEIDHDGILRLSLRTARISNRALNHRANRAKRGKSEGNQ